MRCLGLALSLSLALAATACTGDHGEQGPPGGDGNDGKNALATTTPEPAGANCEFGGVRVQVGIDTNADGTLDAAEVTSTSYICDGNSGHDSLVRVVEELAGPNCPYGGSRIETGLDVDDDGTLDP